MGNAFKLKEERFRKHKEEKFYTEGGETQAEVAQRGRGCPFSGNIQDQVGEGSELPHLVEGSPAPCKVVGLHSL